MIRFSLILDERVFKFAVFLMKISLVIIGVFQLFLQFNLLVDKLLVLEGQGLVLALSAFERLKKCSDLLVSLLEPGLVTDLRELIVNRDDC